MSKIVSDPRIDPRIKALMGMFPSGGQPDIGSREELLAEVNTPDALAVQAATSAVLDALDNEDVAPSTGLTVTHPRVRVRARRQHDQDPVHPAGLERSPAVRVLHPRRRHADDVVLRRHVPGVGPDHRRAGRGRRDGRLPQLRSSPSSAPEVAPFPAGLNDCVSGLKWVRDHADELGHRRRPPDRRRRERRRQPHARHRAQAEARRRPRPDPRACTRCARTSPGSGRRTGSRRRSRTTASCSTCTTTAVAIGYGIEEFDAGNPLAWPSFADRGRRRGLVPTVISVNECDPLRDEGIEFYRLLAAGRRAGALPAGDGHDPRHRDLRRWPARTSAARRRRASPSSAATPEARRLAASRARHYRHST